MFNSKKSGIGRQSGLMLTLMATLTQAPNANAQTTSETPAQPSATAQGGPADVSPEPAQGAEPQSAETATAAESTLTAALSPANFTAPEKKALWADQKKSIELTRSAGKLAAEQKCAEAIPLYAEAYGLAGKEPALRGALDCAKNEKAWVEAHDVMSLLIANHPGKDEAAQAKQATELEEIAGQTVILTLSRSTEEAELFLDGKSVVDGDFRLSAGKHQVRATRDGFNTFEQELDLANGAAETLKIELTETKPDLPPAVDRGEVIDFCRIKMQSNATTYQRQRLVIFDVSGREVTHKPESEVNKDGDVIGKHHVLRDVNAHAHLRNVFAGSFPMERFYTVTTRLRAPEALAEKKSISEAEMIRAAELDQFAAYSLACADWAAIPRVVEKTGTWEKLKKERTVYDSKGKSHKETYYVWDLSLTLGLEMDVYRHTSGSWELHATVEGSNGGLLGAAFALAAGAPSGSSPNGAGRLLVSPPPSPTCPVDFGSAISKLAEGYASCGEASTKAMSLASSALPSDEEKDAEPQAVNEKTAKNVDDAAAEDADAKNGDDSENADAKNVDDSDAAAKEESTASNDDEGEKAQKDEQTESLDAPIADQAASTETEVSDAQTGGETPASNSAEGDQTGEPVAVAEAKSEEAGDSSEKAVNEEPKQEETEATDSDADEPSDEDAQLAALQAVAVKDPTSGLAALAKLEGTKELSPELQAAALAAKAAVKACKGGVDSVVELSGELRKLASQPLSTTAIGFTACAASALAFDLKDATPVGTSQKSSAFCRNVKNDTKYGVQAMRDVATCQSRISTERATLAIQKEAKRLDGWKLFSPLQERPKGKLEGFGISMGKDEGAKRGDLYLARRQMPNGETETVGFGRIIEAGPGGDAGKLDPSHFKFRSGEAPLGTRMEERAYIGVLLGAGAELGFFYLKGDLKTTLPVGILVHGGYNASPFVSIGDEFWARMNIGAAGGANGESFLTFEFIPEAQWYAFDGAAWYTALGFSALVASKSLTAEEAGSEEDLAISTVVPGIHAGAGVDYMPHPDINIRFGASVRQGLTTGELSHKDTDVKLDGGMLSLVKATLSGIYTF